MQLPNVISGTFNRPITLGTGTVELYKDGVLHHTYTQADITLVGNDGFTIDMTGDVTTTGVYHHEISEGLFVSVYNEDFSISNDTDWTYEVVTGDWLSTDWDSNDFLIYN
jgi:hypothetical protein